MTLNVAKTKYEHVVLDEKQVPIVAGTNMKIIELVLEVPCGKKRGSPSTASYALTR